LRKVGFRGVGPSGSETEAQSTRPGACSFSDPDPLSEELEAPCVVDEPVPVPDDMESSGMSVKSEEDGGKDRDVGNDELEDELENEGKPEDELEGSPDDVDIDVDDVPSLLDCSTRNDIISASSSATGSASLLVKGSLLVIRSCTSLTYISSSSPSPGKVA
jgi:hypothetical protein